VCERESECLCVFDGFLECGLTQFIVAFSGVAVPKKKKVCG